MTRRILRVGAVCLGWGLLLAGSPVPARADTIRMELDFDRYGHVPNASCPDVPRAQGGVCAASAVINAFAFLRNRYPAAYGDSGIVRDTDGDGDIDLADLRRLRAELAVNGWDADGRGPKPRRPGLFVRTSTDPAQDVWEAKVEWIEDWAPDTTVVKGQVRTSSDTARWRAGDRLANKFPEWDFLFSEIKAGEAVEVVIFRVGQAGSGHALTLTGVILEDRDNNGRFTAGELRRLILLDSNSPNQKLTTRVESAADGSLRLRYRSNEWAITAAFSESPKADKVSAPSTGVLLAIGLLAAKVIRTKRLRRARGVGAFYQA